MRINYTIKDKKDRMVYNVGDFSIEMLRKELYNLFNKPLHINDPTRTLIIRRNEDKL